MSKNTSAFMVCIFVVIALTVFSCKSAPTEEPVQEQPTVEAPVEVKPVEPVIEKPAPEPVIVETAVEEPVKEDKTAQITELGDSIAKARQKAIESGAQVYVPEVLSVLDQQLDEAVTMFENAEDQDVVLSKGYALLDYYAALEKVCLALTLQARIEGFSFQSYDADSYNTGLESLSNTEKLYLEGSESSLVKEQADIAFTKFKAVIDAAFRILAQSKRSDALLVRADADAIKAGAADKSGYNSAMLKFTTAESKMAEKDFENAYNLYVDSHNALLEIYERVLVKRKAAEEAIARAKSKNDAVDRYALEADSIAPLPSDENTTEAAQ